jgi:hypothetical protein
MGRARCIFTLMLMEEDNRVTSRKTVEHFKLCEGLQKTRKQKRSAGDTRKDQGVRYTYLHHHHPQLPVQTSSSCKLPGLQTLAGNSHKQGEQ